MKNIFEKREQEMGTNNEKFQHFKRSHWQGMVAIDGGQAYNTFLQS